MEQRQKISLNNDEENESDGAYSTRVSMILYQRKVIVLCDFVESNIEPVLDLELSDNDDEEDDNVVDDDTFLHQFENENDLEEIKFNKNDKEVEIDMTKWGKKRAYFGTDFVDDELNDTDEEDREKGTHNKHKQHNNT